VARVEAQYEIRILSLRTLPLSMMNASIVESRLQDTIAAYESRTYRSVRVAANAISIPLSTLSYRFAERSSRSQAHNSEQIRSHAKEKTLV
jgi:peptidoglycan/LPS O-acetylase OafA/YrhL